MTDSLPADPPETWLTVNEVAALQRVNRKTVLRWIASGQLPASRLGRAWRISSSQLHAMLNGPQA
jgi:excisionase family DNA binding protein